MKLTPLDVVRLARGFFTITRDPRNLDGVLSLADDIARREGAFEAAPEALAGQLDEFVLPDPLPTLDALRFLPDGTLGREYARFMDENGLTPDALERPPQDATKLEEFRAHMRGCHDIWHVATGWTPDLLGELGLQAFYLAQLRVPFPAFVLAAGMLHVVWKERRHFYEVVDAVAEGWRQGVEAQALAPVDWTVWLATPLDEVRDELALRAARRRDEPVIPLLAA